MSQTCKFEVCVCAFVFRVSPQTGKQEGGGMPQWGRWQCWWSHEGGGRDGMRMMAAMLTSWGWWQR
eukprot:9282649-Alexandrium_andersonii.AAC.1